MDLQRRAGETDYEYHKRLVYGKLVDKTMADADYSELAEIIYGKPYSSDVARRMLYGSKSTFEMMDNEFANKRVECGDTDIIHELDQKRIELQKERQRFLDQRREFNKLVTEDARWDRLCDTIRSSVIDMSSMEEMFGSHSPICVSTDGLCEAEAVLVFSDWHYGMTADNVFNTYNTSICRERVSKVVRKAIERVSLHECKKVHIVVLGDCIHGAIHTGTRVSSEELTVDQLMQASEILAQSIYMISKFVPSADVYMTYGNHARTIQNKADSIHRDNIERIMPWWLQQRLKEYTNIKIITPSTNEFSVFNVCGHYFCAAHGDIDGIKSSPRLLSTLFQKKQNIDIEYVLLGDKHHAESFEELGVSAMMCGSLCGADDYANEHRLYSEPSQLLLIVSPDLGVDAEYRLKC